MTDDHDQAMQLLQYRLTDLAANLMRIGRGGQGGAPGVLLSQAQELVQAFADFETKVGRQPWPHEIADLLHVYDPCPESSFADGLDRIIGGALRMAAARLSPRMNQEGRGKDEILDGIHVIEKDRDARNAALAKLTPAERHAALLALLNEKKRAKTP